MRFTRRRSDRPGPDTGRPGSKLEALESRELLTGPSGIPFYQPSDLPPRTVSSQTAILSSYHPLSSGLHVLTSLDNEGKVVTGVDRQGDQWSITVHGPGSVIVTDTSPNDGILDDEIDTIQLVGTSPTSTYVTGQTVASSRLQTDGVIFFDHLVAPQGVASIVLNGFTLARTAVEPAGELPGANPEIFLPGGVHDLQFHNIQVTNDQATGLNPIEIIIGNSTTPLTVKPSIRIDSIFNTVFNSTVNTNPDTPQTTPTVNLVINGRIQDLNIVSSTAQVIDPALQFLAPTVGITGRTAVRALAVDDLRVSGSARNLTVSRRAVPFNNGFSGIERLGSATFGGNADAVGLDVAGPIGRLQFFKGLGNPTGTSVAATNFGQPVADIGYPGRGFLGGLVTATRIGSIAVAPANTVLQTSSEPDMIVQHRLGTTTYFPRLGTALTNAAIVSSGSIGKTTVIGNSQNSEIKSGYHYPSFVAGLEPTRAPSQIQPVRYRGDLINSAISATYRSVGTIYGRPDNIAGPGRIRGNFQGVLVNTGQATPLVNTGAGFFARSKVGYLPPPERARRIDGVLVNA